MVRAGAKKTVAVKKKGVSNFNAKKGKVVKGGNGTHAAPVDGMSKGQRQRAMKKDRLSARGGLVSFKGKLNRPALFDMKGLQLTLEAKEGAGGAEEGGGEDEEEEEEGEQTLEARPGKAKAGAPPVRQMSAKQRKRLGAMELAQAKAVLSHPVYQQNPLQALQMHIQNTTALQKQAAAAKR